MNYEFNEKETAFLSEIDELTASFADKAGQKVDAPLKDVLARFAKTPYLSLAIEDVPDMGGLVVLMAAWERFAAAYPSLFLTVGMSTRVFGRVIAAHGTDTQKEKWLTPLLAGEILGAVALSEEAMNVQNDPLTVAGKEDGDNIVVNGVKNYVVNAPVANAIAVVGQLGDGLGFFIVNQDMAGVTIGEPMATLGYEGALISSVSLDNCAVPRENVLGPYPAEKVLTALKLWENQVLLGATLGTMKAALEAAKKHAKEHKTGGRPAIAYQEVGFKLAEMLTMLQTSELMAYRAAWTAENNPKEAFDLTLCAKVFCAESAESVASGAMQILSGAGFAGPNAAERAFRNAKYAQIAGTSTEICRVKIGDAALGYK